MFQIIDENRKPSTAEKFNMGMSGINRELKQYQAQQEARKQQQIAMQQEEQKRLHDFAKMEKEYGYKGEFSNLQHRQNKELEQLKQKGKEGENKFKNQQDAQEKLAPFQAGLQTINQMRNLRKKENIGYGSGITGIFSPETRKDRAEYKTLGNSLISLASTIPIRNKAEFETLTGQLNDPSITLDEMDGVLDALERIINQNMQQYQGMGSESVGFNQESSPQMQPQRQPQKNRPPLSSFHR